MICEGHLVCDDCHKGIEVVTIDVLRPADVGRIELEIRIGETVEVKSCGS